jgi:hypothetical protein
VLEGCVRDSLNFNPTSVLARMNSMHGNASSTASTQVTAVETIGFVPGVTPSSA